MVSKGQDDSRALLLVEDWGHYTGRREARGVSPRERPLARVGGATVEQAVVRRDRGVSGSCSVGEKAKRSRRGR